MQATASTRISLNQMVNNISDDCDNQQRTEKIISAPMGTWEAGANTSTDETADEIVIAVGAERQANQVENIESDTLPAPTPANTGSPDLTTVPRRPTASRGEKAARTFISIQAGAGLASGILSGSLLLKAASTKNHAMYLAATVVGLTSGLLLTTSGLSYDNSDRLANAFESIYQKLGY